LLGTGLSQVFEKSGFAGACLAGKEDRP